MSDIGLFEAIYSARSIRKLSADPVPEELITRVLETATQAPSGGNAQNWAFVVVRDPEMRGKLGAIYRKGSDIASAVYAARGRPNHLSEAQYQRFMRGGAWLWDHLAQAPVILIPCRARHGADHQPFALRGRPQGSARHPRRCDDLRADADRLAVAEFRAPHPQAGARGRLRRSLGKCVGGVRR
jgi:nitroreductase